ncbi:MAG: hypothetical protein ACLGH0_15655 [Thermoanaerobaculia bacterium]
MGKSRLWLWSLLLVAAVHVQASSIIPMDVAKQVDEADLIFVGKVIGIESVPVRDGSFAFTYVTFDVEETLKGATDAPTVTLRVAGGKVRSRRYEIAGGPRFENGGRHLLFVLGNDRYAIPLSGGSQGKLNLVRDPVTQEEILTDDAGRVIDGLRDKEWARSGLSIDRGGQLQRPERVAEVISQEGVTVTLEQPDPSAETVPAAKVLGELRALIQARAFASEFSRGPVVQSASPANVPASDPDRLPAQKSAQ